MPDILFRFHGRGEDGEAETFSLKAAARALIGEADRYCDADDIFLFDPLGGWLRDGREALQNAVTDELEAHAGDHLDDDGEWLPYLGRVFEFITDAQFMTLEAAKAAELEEGESEAAHLRSLKPCHVSTGVSR